MGTVRSVSQFRRPADVHASPAHEAAKYFDPVVLNESVSISLKHRYVYFEVPKAASTSVNAVLHELELRDLPDPYRVSTHPPSVSSPFVKPYQIPPALFHEVLTGPGFVRFSIVRNPFTRTLSSFLDKLFLADRNERAFYRDQLGFDSDGPVAFKTFLERLAVTPPEQMNKHWRPQVIQSFHRFVDLDFIGRAEDLSADLATIAARLGVALGPVPANSPNATGAADRLAAYYDSEAVAMVASVYAADFAAFGYSPHLEFPSPGPR